MTEQQWPYPGSRWWKFDFHTHTPASLDTTAWQNAIDTPDEVTPEKWLLKYMKVGIDCVAVTDHNSGAWVDQLKEAYKKMKDNPPAGFRELHLFPGVEISVHGGFHLLAILDTGATTKDIEKLLVRVDYDGTPGESDGVTRKGAAEVVQEVLDAGGLPIPAHVDRDKGLLQTQAESRKSRIDANTLRQVLEHQGILAMEQKDLQTPLPTVFTSAKVRWARVLGSDCHSFQGSHKPDSRYTWIKMAEPTLEGLRLALLDGDEFSTHCSDDAGQFGPFKLPKHFIQSIRISKARFMGRAKPEYIEFTPYYNALIGGRGTGKSTVIHALRLACQRHNELQHGSSQPFKDFKIFCQEADDHKTPGALQKDTEISINFFRDGIYHRLHWRADGEGDVVEEWDGTAWHVSDSQTVSPERFPVRLFSQGQIADMASDNRQTLMGVIDEAMGSEVLNRNLEEAKKSFFTLYARWRELGGKLQWQDEVERKLKDLHRKLESFIETHHAEVLKAHQRASRQRHEVDTLLKQVEQIPEQMRQFTENFVLDDWPEGVFDAEADVDILTWRKGMELTVKNAREQVQKAASALAETISIARSGKNFKAWQARFEQAQQSYDALKATLAEQGVQDPQEFGRLVQERQQLEAEHKQLDKWKRDRETLETQIIAQYQHMVEAREKITKAREEFLNKHLANNNFVRISVAPFGFDAKIIERSLREMLGVEDNRFENDILLLEDGKPQAGLVADFLQATDYKTELKNIKRRLAKIENLGGHFHNYMQRKLEQQPEFADRIRCWFPEDDLRIEYCRMGDGTKFTPITQGSAGQRAAAMLAFLLAFGDEPLILDQPEDDLDNHLIYDLIVRQIRENKKRRQLIVVTHNPNIVVNGDAEMVHALDFLRGQCRVKKRGALQEKELREEVCHIMEGGREAFSRRWARLGREL